MSRSISDLHHRLIITAGFVVLFIIFILLHLYFYIFFFSFMIYIQSSVCQRFKGTLYKVQKQVNETTKYLHVHIIFRFNLLLLEPGEIYFEDYSVYYYPSVQQEDEAIKK